MLARAATWVVLSLVSPVALAAGIDCEAIDKSASERADVIQGYQSGRDVIGKGRAQFYSAPDHRCPMAGAFLVPRDGVNAYLEVDGFTFVLYFNPRTEVDTEGWIETSRLRINGVGISPQQ